MSPDEFLERILTNATNAAILARLPALCVDDAMLTAGCLVQTVWNQHAGRPPDASIADYDLFYFDDRDLSWEAEDVVIRRGAALFADLGVTVEIRNQARVHLWYPERFGAPYPELASTRAGIDRFLVACTCVGVAGRTLYAPYGLDDVAAGILRPNPSLPKQDGWRAKAESYARRWPFLRIVDA